MSWSSPGIAMRRLRDRARRARRSPRPSRRARRPHPALPAEVESACRVLNAPAARLIARGEERPLLLDEVEALHGVEALVVDATAAMSCAARGTVVSLATRPVLFALARALAEAWPEDVPRDALVARAFRRRSRPMRSHRARLRVEIGRLRAVLRALAEISATQAGLRARRRVTRRGRRAGAARRGRACGGARVPRRWRDPGRARRLRLALGASQRSVQRRSTRSRPRARCRCFGHGRARRWMTPPVPGFTTTLLLPAPLPSGCKRMAPQSDGMTDERRSAAEIIREYGPFRSVDQVAGVTYRRPACLVRRRATG